MVFFLPDFVYFFSFYLSFCEIICKFVGKFIRDNKTNTNIYKKLRVSILETLSFFYRVFYRIVLSSNLTPLWWGGVIDYIMPPIPGAPPIGIAGSGAGLSHITDSVVRNSPATEAAFSSATRATFAGSMIPAFFMSS